MFGATVVGWGVKVLTTACLDLLTCLKSGEDLRLNPDGLHLVNTSGSASYPVLGGIPWLYADTGAALFQWRSNISAFLESSRQEEESLAAASSALDRSQAKTRVRLETMRSCRNNDRRSIAKLLRPVLRAAPESLSLDRILAEKLPLTQSLTSYYSNVHRDWTWDLLLTEQESENRIALQHIVAASSGAFATGEPCGVAAVFGAGACRLAYDIHMAHKQLETIALDINPLLFAVARSVMMDEPVELCEYPLAPTALAHHGIPRTLRAPQSVRPGFSMIHGDALNPPLKGSSLDWLITPWFVDIVAQAPQQVLAVINRCLRPGGVWTNYGTVVFHTAEAADRWSVDEFFEGVQEAGFAFVGEPQFERVPYMASPASSHARIERVVHFSARKVHDAARTRLGRPAAVPPWALDPSIPVPRTQQIAAFFEIHKAYAQLAGLIDGSRSVHDIAGIMAGSFGLPLDDARRAFLKVALAAQEGQTSLPTA